MTWSRTSQGAQQTAQEIATAIDADTVAEATLRGALGLVETVTASPSANQNNYAPSTISTSKAIYTFLELTPSATIKITGLSTTSWETGKRVMICNGGSPTAAGCRLIVLERLSASSSAANQFSTPYPYQPILIMPGECLEFRFDGTNLKLTGGNRGGGWRSVFDETLRDYDTRDTAGTGARSVRWYQTDTSTGITFPGFLLETGTTNSGFGVAYTTDRHIWAGQAGAMLVHSRMSVDQLSTASEEFRFFSGFTSHYLDAYAYADAAEPTEIIGWRYDRAISTSWQQVTRDNGTGTVTNILSVTAGEVVCFMAFVNGDGTRVDFLHSDDLGATWTISSTSHTTNIPANSARGMDIAASFAKTVGTTEVFGRVSGIAAIMRV